MKGGIGTALTINRHFLDNDNFHYVCNWHFLPALVVSQLEHHREVIKVNLSAVLSPIITTSKVSFGSKISVLNGSSTRPLCV